MMNNILHIIEPTLVDETGHAYSYITSLLTRNNGLFIIHLWASKKSKLKNTLCIINKYFIRPIRELQKIWLYYKLLRGPGKIFISTAKQFDLILLNLLAPKNLSANKIYCNFHQYNITTKKLKALSNIANSRFEFNIFATTDKLLEIFITAGFKNTKVVPCPTYANLNTNVIYSIEDMSKFHKIIFAGAARHDKGFGHVVNLLQYLRAQANFLPFELQISRPASGKYDAETLRALDTLTTLPEQNLILHQQTLTVDNYQKLFANAICLLLYNTSYANKFSGVALDAIYAGAPIITTPGSWISDVTERFHIGIVVPDLSPQAVFAAITTIQNDYATFAANTRKASHILSIEHDAMHTLIALKGTG